jgi:DNA-binding transcriptional MerR regulator
MKTYTIGQFAKTTGLTRRALRLYEAAGLLAPAREINNYRVYTETQVQNAAVIRELRAAGLPLAAIQALFDLKRSDLSVREKLGQVLDLLDDLRGDLLARRQAIDTALHRLDEDRQELQERLAADQEGV